eukprot:TRINITY_DN48875_c0_g1_i1.p1 TRINITY_DN48875_c0_g1~~TRINITY_DN48875_c0_g1_i1.p1  ORF type:complete len:438 (+),score=73.56 TRINITY_DN48875_c0_g1_i1:165-1478(+)
MYGASASRGAKDLEACGGDYVFKLPGFRGRRRRMNFVALWLALCLPVAIFVLISTVLAYRMRHDTPLVSLAVCALILAGIVAVLGGRAAQATWEKTYTDGHRPSWYIFLFWTSLLAFLLGALLGNFIYYRWTQRYYDTATMSVYGNTNQDGSSPSATQIAASEISRGARRQPGGYPAAIGPASPAYGHGGLVPTQVSGTQLLDAGAVFFAWGSYLDTGKAMSFSKDPMYCVAPISFGTLEPAVYDMWAVGVDCCGDYVQSNDNRQRTEASKPPNFHCGAVGNPMARAGLRVMDDTQIPLLHLAVKQAEAAYGIVSRQPIFFHWMEDPINGETSSGCSFGRYSYDPNATDDTYVTSPYQTGCGSQFGLRSDRGFLGLWPFRWSDLGFGGASVQGGGGINALHRSATTLQIGAIFAYVVVQLLLVTLAACSFATLGFNH